MYTITKQGNVAIVTGAEKVIVDANSAMDLLMDAIYNWDCHRIAIDKRLVAEEFFILSSGLAGEILQKYVNYGGKIGIWGDYSRYTSKPLKDFIYESNKGNNVFFVETQEEAVSKLSSAK